MMVVLFSCNFDVVVWRTWVLHLPMPPSWLETLIVFIKQFMNWVTFHLGRRRCSKHKAFSSDRYSHLGKVLEWSCIIKLQIIAQAMCLISLSIRIQQGEPETEFSFCFYSLSKVLTRPPLMWFLFSQITFFLHIPLLTDHLEQTN